MNINELDSFDLADAVKFNDELNPRIWQGSRMRPEVRRKLLAIAKDFKQSLGLTDLEVKDITVSGSNAGYTYTPHSDIDLHLVVDIPQADTSEVYRELFNAKKYQYNDEHNLAIGGYPVELYVENANTPPVSQGMFSVLANDWINIPRKRKSTVNDDAVKSKYELMKHRIESAIASNDIKRLTKTAARIKQMRQAGLDKNGELGPENLAYKILRTQGLIEKLYAARTAAKDELLSLQERKKKKSRVRYGFGGYYTPGFSFGGETSGDGGGESVGEDATISPYGVNPTTQMFLNETDDAEQTVRDFIEHAADRLGIERIPEIKLHSDLEWSQREHSFGRYTPNTHTLEVSLANRHVMDILRTVAHELVHCRQHELSPLPDEAGETGSRWENEAHAKAGELMRDYADAHPNKFGEHALSEASGYIPTRAQAKDKRFSTALTVDVHPGQTGKEANKMALQTDAQGRPALLMKEFANQLHEEFEQFDEGVALFEIKMTGKNLRAEAAKTGAIAGMEFEMIVPNVEGGDEDAEPEPDWDYDESVNSISDAVDFFDDAGQNSRRDLERLRERMQENYHQWLSDQFQSQWERDDSEFVFNYIKENASPEEIAEILDIELDGDSYPDTIDRQALLDATEKVVADGYSNRWYNDAYETAQEEFNNDADQESEWLEDQEINTMQDVMNTFGVVDWPHWNTPSGGDRSIEDVANDFQDAIGIDVQASTNYHAGSVDRPSTSSHHYVVEPDGSLTGDDYGDRGLEFVSPPLPIDVILNDLNKVKRWADSYGCYTNDSTGLHINISVPDYSRDKLDFVKLAILMGDEYVSDSFGRLGAYYAKSAMGMIRDNVRSRPEAVADALEKMRTHMNTAASKAIHAGVTQKFTSINVKDGHIEFRSPGGDWLGENFNKIENTLLRFTVAMSAALNPEMYREEYLKKLYKILNPEGQKDEYGDMIQEFSKYMASLQGGGAEASGKLSKETQQAIKDFRTAASKELKQKNLANKLKKGDTAGQKYWWNVSWGNGRVEVVATTKEEAIDKAFLASYWEPENDHTPQAIQFRNSLRAKPLSPYYEKSKPSVWKVYGSNSSPYQRLGVEVVATDEFEAMQKARQKWNLNVGGRTEEEFFSTNGWSAERIGDAPAEQTTKYEIYNKQTGNLVEPADGIANDADALVRLNDYIEHGPHTLNREQATAVFGIRTNSGVEIVDIDIPMAQGRAQTSPTGKWKIIDGLGRYLYVFLPAENTRAKANELAALWARENNFDGNYQVEPVEDRSTGQTTDQQQGGLIDVAGSTNDLAQQRATPGTFTGAWKIIDNDGNEMHRFSGVGNNQRDANRVATQWIQNNGYAYGTEIEVVPIMSESIAEGFSNSPQTVTRIDSKPITDFVSSLKAYKHTDDWSQSGVDTGDDSYWKKKNLKTNTTKGLFAGDPHRTALYATGNAHETRYVEFTQNGQPVVYFDQKDLPAMRSRKTYLTVFDAANFKKLPTGEYFSENPGQPLTQTEISDPFQYIASQGWIVRVTPDLNKVFKQVQYMHQNGKIQQYGAEGMSESIAEGADKKYTIKKSYTMSKAGVEKSVWHIMDGDFVVDVTDLRRDAKYYADKWNAAEKESSNASQNQHKQGVAESYLDELANTSLKVKEPKNFVNVNDRNQVIYKVMKFKSGKDTYLINFTVKGAPAYGKKSNWNAVNVSFGVREEQDDYSFGDEINTDLTARNKNQFLIYSTVINAVRKFITEYNTEIDEIIMQGAGERQAVMYQRFFQSAGKYFPGWHYDGKHSLVRDVPRQQAKKVREQGVAEGMPQPSQGQGKYRDLNAPLGPETPPQMPAGTTKVDVSDTQDWYQLGMDISNISAAKPEEYNQGPPHTVIVFPSDEFEQPYLKQFKRLGLKTHDIDPPGQEDVDEGVEFFSMPLRMSEYRGKQHPATKQPYDSKFKFSGDLKDRVHGLLDAGTKPTLLQVNPRHLLATQDWLSTQGGGKPPFATMKQHPVVLQKNNKLYILDGHHRSADALKAGAPIEVYLFRDEL